ncbi:hypothetical protein [Thioclava sp. F36-6]|uniref:hypothetical protein n=1 Tax=Thioclava sp. F36-6 TaxID=1915316 RepID=UPI0011BAC6C8|nr:hypothetical protein [Thioclava sp. F36-6]
MGKVVFITYATGNFTPLADELCQSALRVGFDEAKALGPNDLSKEFKTANAALLAEKRGAGYWAWKPEIIRNSLNLLSPGDLLVYCDSGRNPYYRFNRFPGLLAKRAMKEGLLLNATVPQHGNLARWTKRDCLTVLNMDRDDVICRPQIQSGWSFWTPCEMAFRVLDDWGKACTDPRCVSDSPNTLGLPNYPEFVDHRHDQSILTLLIYRDQLPHLDYRSKGLSRILMLRRKSALAQRFMSRIDDAEMMEQGKMVSALVRSFFDLRRFRKHNIEDGRLKINIDQLSRRFD